MYTTVLVVLVRTTPYEELTQWCRPDRGHCSLVTADALRPNHTRPETVPLVRASCRVKSFLPVPPYKPSTQWPTTHAYDVPSCPAGAADVRSRNIRNGRLAKPCEVRTDRRACQRFRSLILKHFSRHRTGRTEHRRTHRRTVVVDRSRGRWEPSICARIHD